MSGTITRTAPDIHGLRQDLERLTPELRNALPSHIKPEKFQRVVMTVVQQSPDLLKADRRSLFASCIKCAADGLIPDGREAALTVFGNQVQYLPMLAGVLKRIRNSGEVSGITAQVVYENDHFVERPDDFDRPIEHRKTPLGTDPGKPLGAYALARLKDGTLQAAVMDIHEIEKVRSVSRSKDRGPWVQWWAEMAKKSAVHRLSKLLPVDAEVEDLFRRDDTINGVAESQGSPISLVHMPELVEEQRDPFQRAAAGETPPSEPEKAGA